MTVSSTGTGNFKTRLMNVFTCLFIVATCACLSSGEVFAGNDSAKKSEVSREKTKKGPVSAKSESQALALVEAHLPGLREVLDRLREEDRTTYDRAIRDLAKSARKLESARRDERFFDIEVERLKSQSQVNMLTARLKIRNSEEDRKDLMAAAKRLYEAQLSRVKYDVDFFRQRLRKTEQHLEQAQQRLKTKSTNQEQEINRIYTSMMRQAGRLDKTPKPISKQRSP